jgi:hypothetical protein
MFDQCITSDVRRPERVTTAEPPARPRAVPCVPVYPACDKCYLLNVNRYEADTVRVRVPAGFEYPGNRL